MQSLATSAVYFCVAIIELLIGVRVLLKLFGANEVALFVRLIYDLSHIFFVPFEGMFPSISFALGSVLELSAIFALVVYLFLGYLVNRLIELIRDSLTHQIAQGKGKQPPKEAVKEKSTPN